MESVVETKAVCSRGCTCGNTDYEVFDIRIDSRGRAILTLGCPVCKATWQTRSRAARKYVNPDKILYPNTYIRKAILYKDVLEEADRKRRAVLQSAIRAAQTQIAGLDREIQAAQAELAALETAAVPAAGRTAGRPAMRFPFCRTGR